VSAASGLGRELRNHLLRRAFGGGLQGVVLLAVARRLLGALRRRSGRRPELVYRASLRRESVLAVRASQPLPRRVRRNKAARAALAEAYRADLAEAGGGGR
jgi:hypothetical protein